MLDIFDQASVIGSDHLPAPWWSISLQLTNLVFGNQSGKAIGVSRAKAERLRTSLRLFSAWAGGSGTSPPAKAAPDTPDVDVADYRR